MAGKLPGRAISNTATITVAAITVGNAVVNSSIIALGNSTVNTYINSTSVSTALSVNVGSNVFVNTSTIHLGNSTVNTVIHTTGFTGNGAGIHGINADSIATGTLNTARLPATVNVSSAINVGANLNINTSTIFIGNSTVNTTIIAGNVNLQGTELRVGNVVVNGNQLSVGNVTITDAQISVGNSTVNTVLGSTGSLSGNGSQLSSVNAIALQGNSVSDILTSANTAANTLANAAYSNAVSYAASNTYVNNTFLPLAGGTITGTIAVGNSTVNSVVNSTAASLGNTTINGFVNVSSNLTVTSVAAFGNNVTITGNLIVTGTRIFANTTTVDLSDNIITLNADIGEVTPSENAGLEVHRGTSANVQFVWNETIDKWTFTTDGTTYVTVASNNDVTTAYSNAIAYSGNAALAYSNATTYASNADNISSGTLNTARLPATVNVSTVINVGANLNINTNSVQIGNSTANIVFSQSTVTINGVSHSFESIVSNATGANSVMIRNSAGDSAVGSRFHFTSAVADGGAFGLIGLNWGGAANTFKNFEVYDYVNARPMFRSYGETRNFEIFGTANAAALILTTNTATIGTAAYVVANGNVGIGSAANTSRRLYVSISTTDSVNGAANDASSYPVSRFMAHSSGGGIRGLEIGVPTGGVASPVYIKVAETSVRFAILNNSGTEQFTILNDGNVGIGNTSPASKLTVTTNSANSGYQTALDFASIGLQIESANATGQGVIAFTFGGTVRSTVRGDYVGNLILSPKSGGMYYGFDASGANTVEHRFYSNSSTTSVLFAANGNVGIGTTTPIHKLQVVNGTIGVSDGAATSRGRLFWTTSGFTGIGLYNDDNSSIVFGTTGTARVEIDLSGNMLPFVNATYNLGSSTRRWSTVFTSDLDLSNGIGDWTIVEGEDDLFIYNNKRGKVYKFKLEEVDPATATPKKENL